MGAELTDLLRLERSQIGPAAETLVKAFHTYPLLQNPFPDEAQRHRVGNYFHLYSLHYGIRYGEAYAASPNLEGVAIWIPSTALPMTLWRMIRAVPLSVLFGLGRSGAARIRHVGDFIDAAHKRLAPFEHWYLQVIGVDPQCQGQGHAGRLLGPMLARIDEERLPCYLETLVEKNVRLYEHFGFEVVEEAPIPKSSLTNWAMLRKAQQSA
jgi:ribosomal protein S18 acetylase RimI-like enzyme